MAKGPAKGKSLTQNQLEALRTLVPTINPSYLKEMRAKIEAAKYWSDECRFEEFDEIKDIDFSKITPSCINKTIEIIDSVDEFSEDFFEM